MQLLQEVGASMVAPAVEETTLQAMEAMALILGWAAPVRLNVVELPWEHVAWSAPASASPNSRLIWRGVIKSTMFADGDCDSLVFTRMVLTPMLAHGSKAVPMSAVKSTAPSAKVFFK